MFTAHVYMVFLNLEKAMIRVSTNVLPKIIHFVLQKEEFYQKFCQGLIYLKRDQCPIFKQHNYVINIYFSSLLKFRQNNQN